MMVDGHQKIGPEVYPDEPLASLSRIRVQPATTGAFRYYSYPRFDDIPTAYSVYEDEVIRVRVVRGTYFLHFSKRGGRYIKLSFPDRFSGSMNVQNVPDRAFLAEVWRVEAKDYRYVCFFLYPHVPRVHIWLVDESGLRKTGIELPRQSIGKFLAFRASENIMFAYRLLLMLKSCETELERGSLLLELAEFDRCGFWDLSSGRFLSKNNLDGRGEVLAFVALMQEMKTLLRTKDSLIGPIDSQCATPPGKSMGRQISDTPLGIGSLVDRLGLGLLGTDLLRAADAAQLTKLILPESRRSLIEHALENVWIREMTDKEQSYASEQRLDGALFYIHSKPCARIEVGLPRFFVNLAQFHSYVQRNRLGTFGYFPQVRQLITYLSEMVLSNWLTLFAAVRSEIGRVPPVLAFYATWHDFSGLDHVVSYGRSRGNSAPLIPDAHFYRSDAYAECKELNLRSETKWSERSPVVLWRGRTTGKVISSRNFMENERIRLAHFCKDYPTLFDVKIVQVVQAGDADAKAVTDALAQNNLVAANMQSHRFREFQFSIDIDGNANAWGLFEKFALGLCVLKIESPYEEWFYSDLKPWVHYVPISRDLSDLVPLARELQQDPQKSERIAAAATAFAFERDIATESAKFCRDIAKGIGTGAVRVL